MRHTHVSDVCIYTLSDAEDTVSNKGKSKANDLSRAID